MSKEMYTQCQFKKGNKTTYGFIPSKAAKVGNTMQLEIAGEMDPDWKVVSAGTPIEKTALRNLQAQEKGTRQASDI